VGRLLKQFSEKTKLALLGQACGDAFGAPFEYHRFGGRLAKFSMREQRYLSSKDCNRNSPRDFRLPGLYTDDTQQALLLLHAWLQTETPKDAAAHFLANCGAMATEPLPPEEEYRPYFGLHRGTGGNFRESITTGKPVDTAGLGAAMRVGPVATVFDNAQEMVDWLFEVSKTTTSNPIAIASALRYAAVVWVFSHAESRHQIQQVVWPEEIPLDIWHATSKALRIARVEDEADIVAFATMTGWSDKILEGAANGFALTGFPWVVKKALLSNSFSDALVGVCESGGDTDTVAAMAGCLAALQFGRDSIPSWMQDSLAQASIIKDPINWGLQLERNLVVLEARNRRASSIVF